MEKEKETARFKAVRKRKFACILKDKGHQLLCVRANRRYPEQNVWIFKNTPEFQRDLDELIKEL